MSADEDKDILMGHVVEHKMNTNVFGIVIGFMGSLICIRTSPDLAMLWFHEWELRHMDDDGEPLPGKEEDGEGNVLSMADYKLTAKSKTRGAA